MCTNNQVDDVFELVDGPNPMNQKVVIFKDFFRVMSRKLEESKRLKEDVIFEDKETNVSCFLW